MLLPRIAPRRYIRIFGGKGGEEGLPLVADQVLCDFISAFPEGKEKKGMKRGNVCLTQYIHDHGTRKSRKDVGAKQILDRELFATKMEIARKWNPQRCLDEWSKLEADPLNHYDSNGPPWAPLRLRVPGWLLGSDYEAEETENYEQKALRSSSKIEKNMNQESREQILGEVSKGFGHLQPVQQSITAPLPPTAWTLEGSSGSGPVTGLGLLAAVAKQHLAASSPAKAAQAGPGSPGGATESANEKGQDLKGRSIDLPAFRMQKHRACVKEVTDMAEKTLQKVMKDAAELLDAATQHSGEDEYKELAGRAECVLAVLGAEMPRAGESWSAAAGKAGNGIGTSASMTHNDVQNIIAKMKDLPVENTGVIDTIGASLEKANRIAKMTSESQIRQQALAWDEQKMVIKQLGQAVKAATKALAKLVKVNEAMAQRVKKQQEETAEKEKLKELEEASAVAIARAAAKISGLFDVPWHTHGHPQARTATAAATAATATPAAEALTQLHQRQSQQ